MIDEITTDQLKKILYYNMVALLMNKMILIMSIASSKQLLEKVEWTMLQDLIEIELKLPKYFHKIF
jgi:hypothetical protein